jgi:hypothetical protein
MAGVLPGPLAGAELPDPAHTEPAVPVQNKSGHTKIASQHSKAENAFQFSPTGRTTSEKITNFHQRKLSCFSLVHDNVGKCDMIGKVKRITIFAEI